LKISDEQEFVQKTTYFVISYCKFIYGNNVSTLPMTTFLLRSFCLVAKKGAVPMPFVF